jgi:hypothetical protein
MYSKNNYIVRPGRILLFIATAASLCVIIQGYSIGPAKDSDTTVTGAPFNSSRTCARCHSGGNFGGSITTTLLDGGNNPVTSYVPGASYTFRVVMNKTSGNPLYGFQTTAAFTVSSANINNWGSLPSNTHNQLVSGRNYVEHSVRLSSGTISIPWTAPAVGGGAITFWTAGNIVNGANGSSGDQPVNTSLQIEESTLPVIIKYFKGNVEKDGALLQWATETEVNNKAFFIEKSINGKDFVEVASMAANNTGIYTWKDFSFSGKTFYRLVQEDLDGKKTYFNIITLTAPELIKYGISIQVHYGSYYLMFSNNSVKQAVSILIFDMNGKIVHSEKSIASEGSNRYPLPITKNGSYIVSVQTQDGVKTTGKITVVL